MSARSRLRQGVRALIGFARPVDYALAAAHLTESQMALFRRMRHVERLHSLNVLRALRAAGAVDEALAVAALLHDVGKSCYPLALWQKVAVVLVRRLAPRAVARWSMGDPAQLWARPFVVYSHHPAWSADLLRAADASADAVWLAQHHQDDPAAWRDHPLYSALLRLQAADDLN